jgi:hypothetical protein
MMRSLPMPDRHAELIERARECEKYHVSQPSKSGTGLILAELADALEAAERRVGELERAGYGERCEDCSGELTYCGEMTSDGPSLDCPLCRSRSDIAARDAEMLLLAKLAAETPQFDNPLHIVKAQQVRDRILDAALARGTEGE